MSTVGSLNEKKEGSWVVVSTSFGWNTLFSAFLLPSSSIFKFSFIPRKLAIMHMHGQDWNEVVLRKKHTTTSQATSSAAVNAALRSGMVTGLH